MIPKSEFDALTLAASEAFSAAADGRMARAYLLLSVGRQASRATEADWATALTELWEQLIVRLKECYPFEAYPDGF